MLNIFKSIFNHEYKELKRFSAIADEIDALDEEMQKLTDEELKNKTNYFKDRLSKGETLDDILPEAFAVVREASYRVIGEKPFYVQLVGAITVHFGNIAEMKTGEGKTLTLVMPAYLNALTGDGVHVVTVNEYLAGFHASWMGEIFKFLGLTVGVNLRELTPAEKREAYNSDILYSTNNELGFDYLRDNMVVDKNNRVQRVLNFAIVDEVDSILIDEARTPLIISGGFMKSMNLYKDADQFVKSLKNTDDYIIDPKTESVNLTDEGSKKAEKFFKTDNLYDISHSGLVHHITQALRANYIKIRDVDYVVQDGEVIIVDQFTGRLMKGRAFSEGLHQAIEAKESVKVQEETQTLATITFQNYFRMYRKLSGMTGTAKTEEEEFRNIYNMYVITIPTNKPVIRADLSDLVYPTKKGKFNAIIKEIEKRHEAGQPILVGTIAIETSELVSDMLKKKKIPHEVLNAKNHAREAEIIAKAGQKGSVTIATNMAGRGTDIKLGGSVEFLAREEMRKQGLAEQIIMASMGANETNDEEILKARKKYKDLCNQFKDEINKEKEVVVQLGGLCVIGTERHEARRIDNQLRGRSGRQGDPGVSQFYVSFEDDLMIRFGSERFKGMLQAVGFSDEQAIRSRMFSGSIESAQKRVEGNNFDIRKQLLQYDDVMNQQREIIYEKRNKILDNESIHEEVINIFRDNINSIVRSHISPDGNFTDNDFEEITKIVNDELLRKKDLKVNQIKNLSIEEVITKIELIVIKDYEDKTKPLPQELVNDFEKAIYLRVIDMHWMEHINTMDHLREGIHLRGYAQINPLQAYTNEGFDLFDQMIRDIDRQTSIYLLKAEIRQNSEAKEVAKPIMNSNSGKEGKQQPKKSNKIGRNDPCPCGSGKKYKHCCGK